VGTVRSRADLSLDLGWESFAALSCVEPIDGVLGKSKTASRRPKSAVTSCVVFGLRLIGLWSWTIWKRSGASKFQWREFASGFLRCIPWAISFFLLRNLASP